MTCKIKFSLAAEDKQYFSSSVPAFSHRDGPEKVDGLSFLVRSTYVQIFISSKTESILCFSRRIDRAIGGQYESA